MLKILHHEEVQASVYQMSLLQTPMDSPNIIPRQMPEVRESILAQSYQGEVCP